MWDKADLGCLCSPAGGLPLKTRVRRCSEGTVRKGLAPLLSWTWRSGRQEKFWSSLLHCVICSKVVIRWGGLQCWG